VWNYVIPHFNQFLSELQFEPKHRADAEGKAERIAKSLFAKYYPNRLLFDPSCYLVVGSYGKGNPTQPCTDLDMFFILPDEVCGRISQLQGNRQSQLLQEVKNALSFTFPRTDLSADGQIVLCPFDCIRSRSYRYSD
jgi:Second Messenger Oligonucleotide or Dinucleotide Synthetase domain